jgi:hypothetical protein
MKVKQIIKRTAAVVQALASLDLAYPEVGPDKLKELAAAKRALVKK